MPKVLTLSFLILLSVSFSACSRVDLALKWADTFLYYELNSIFDFEGKQKAVVETASDALIRDLKKEWLPVIATRLQQLSEKVNATTDTEIQSILNAEVEFINEHLKKLYAIVAGEVPTLGKAINQENWKYFKEEFESKNNEILQKK